MIPAFLRREPPAPDDYELPEKVIIKRSKRAQRIALRLDSRERVVHLITPERMNLQKALNFAYKHREWIFKQLAELPPQILFEHGAVISVLGQDRRIDISYGTGLKRTNIILKETEIFVSTNKDDPSGRIIRFLKKLAQEELGKRAHEKAAEINKEIPAIQIRDPKSRWGSCGPDGRIAFSWRLILAPYASMDYVIAHEVAHLVHMDHGKEFWALCAELCDSYTKGKKWMRSEGHSLHRYG